MHERDCALEKIMAEGKSCVNVVTYIVAGQCPMSLT